MSHYSAVYRRSDGRKGMVHEIEQDIMAGKQVDMVNINSFSFKNIHSVIVAKLKLSCSQNSAIIQHSIDADSEGNIMAHHILKLLFCMATKEQLVETKT